MTPDEISKQSKDTGDDDGVRAIYEEDTADDILGRDGASGAVDKVVRLDRAALSEARQRTTAERAGKDAADLFSAAVVQSGGPGGGRGLVRLGNPATVCRH